MKKEDFLKNKPLLIMIGLILLFIVVSSLVIYLNIDNLSYPLVLHFNTFQGVDAVGDSNDLWSILLISSIISFINILLGIFFYFRLRLLTYIMISTGVIVSLLSLIAIANIISLN